MTAAVILYAYFALMLYVGIMGTISRGPKRRPDPTAGCAAASTPQNTQE